MKENNEFDILQLVHLIWDKIFLTIICIIVGGVLAGAFSYYFIPSKYTASISMYVYNQKDGQDTTISDINLAVKLVDTYIIILKSDNVLEKVIEQSGLDYTVNQLENMISASSINKTEVFKVQVTAGDPDSARILADTIAGVAPEEIIRVVNAGNVEIIDNAEENPPKTSPKIVKNTLLGLVLGAGVAIVCVIVNSKLDKTIKQESDLTETFGYPLLGAIPGFRKNSAKGGQYGKKDFEYN